MRLRIILPLALLLLASSGVQAQSGGNYDMEWNVIGGSAGEGFVAGGNYQLGFTLAQAQEPQVSSGGNFRVVGGFWFGAPVTVTYYWVYLPIVTKP